MGGAVRANVNREDLEQVNNVLVHEIIFSDNYIYIYGLNDLHWFCVGVIGEVGMLSDS